MLYPSSGHNHRRFLKNSISWLILKKQRFVLFCWSPSRDFGFNLALSSAFVEFSSFLATTLMADTYNLVVENIGKLFFAQYDLLSNSKQYLGV